MYGFITDVPTPVADVAAPSAILALGIGLILVFVIGTLLIGLCVFLIIFNVKKSKRKKAAQLQQQAEEDPAAKEVVFAGAPDESSGEASRE